MINFMTTFTLLFQLPLFTSAGILINPTGPCFLWWKSVTTFIENLDIAPKLKAEAITLKSQPILAQNDASSLEMDTVKNFWHEIVCTLNLLLEYECGVHGSRLVPRHRVSHRFATTTNWLEPLTVLASTYPDIPSTDWEVDNNVAGLIRRHLAF